MSSSESMIDIEHLSKRFAESGTPAVDDLSLSIGEGEICVLIGPSGCGKTTTMRMINRMIEPDSGTIRIAGRDVTHIDAVELRRSVGYVIQQVGLFPHMTIAENVATVPQLLVGAIPVTLLALGADYAFGALQRRITPRGLRHA